MEKRKYLIFLCCLLVFYSLVQPAARAQGSSQANILSQGSISYPSPSPSPSSSPSINLAVIPNNWHLTYGSGPQIIYLDYSVTHNGHPSIRLEPHIAGVDINAARECDGTWYNVRPGDHIVAKCWIKIDDNGNNATGGTAAWSGARIGIDLYNQENGHTYLLYGISSSTYPNTEAGNFAGYVHWGTTGWVQKTIDFVVPTDYFTKNWISGQTIPPTQTSSIIMWLQVWSSALGSSEIGNAWFADAELYINPT
jgi:hypothetical protein